MERGLKMVKRFTRKHAMRGSLLLGAALAMAGCTSFFSDARSRGGVSSSVVDYLYPPGTAFEPAVEGVPEIKLPARVGLMFVPSSRQPAGMTLADRQALLEKVRESFKGQPFIDRIEIIPDTYLRPRGGFENLEQVARLHGFDVAAMVSYDQVTTTGDGAASVLYWTIVGAYTIPATRNQVTTFVDTSVFDLKSRTLLFRAPGQDQRDARSTAIGAEDAIDRLANEGFRASVDGMIANLNTAIPEFGRRARDEGQVKLVDRRSGRGWGTGGGGSVQGWELGLLLATLVLLLVRRRT